MNDPALATLVSLSSAVAVMIGIHPLLQRALRRTPPQRVAILACASGAAALGFATSAKGAPAHLYEASVYTCIAYAYFHLFNMSETARRVRILLEVDAQGDIDETALHETYSDAEVVDKRLKRMVDMGSLELRADRYFVRGHTLHFAARVLDAWRLVLGYPGGPR
jgi:hypothetical protein